MTPASARVASMPACPTQAARDQPPGKVVRADIIERLRHRIARIEGAVLANRTADRSDPQGNGRRPPWQSGIGALDAHLPATGLARAGIHEISAAEPGALAAAHGFAAALARRLTMQDTDSRPVFWCRLGFCVTEHGRLYGHGLENFGISRHRLVTATLKTPQAVLWSVEEALKTGRACVVICDADSGTLGITETRRLALAAARGSCAALMIAARPFEGATAARSRWSLNTLPSRPEADDPSAPGKPAWQVSLQKCRGGRPGEWTLEWDHAAHRFALVPAAGNRAGSECPAQGPAGSRSSLGLAVRAG